MSFKSTCRRSSTSKHGKLCWQTHCLTSKHNFAGPVSHGPTHLIGRPFSSDSTEEESPLSIIIQAMCRDGEAHRLFTLPISGMEGYIEDELDLRARTADPLAAPFYHKILYSWLIMRQDYRKGMETSVDNFWARELILDAPWINSGSDAMSICRPDQAAYGEKCG
jgi:hypothetical protein